MSATETSPSGREKYLEALWIERILRRETVGGMIILGAAVVAVFLANSPLASHYFGLRDTYLTFGAGEFEWKISVGHLTADGLLAIFFFLVGLELKREFVSGELRDPRKALVPVIAAVGGVILPALVYLTITAAYSVPEASRGWAIPIATDIAFALAVLALAGTWLPLALRTFLLTLAVVDDLIGITVIAVFYTDRVDLVSLLVSLAFVGLYGFFAQRYREFFHVREGAAWLVLFPIGFVAWFFMYGSGVHATIAGVLLGLTVPVLRSKRERLESPEAKSPSLAEVFEHRFRVLSAAIAVPLFAFFAAGVSFGNGSGEFFELLSSPVSIGIIAALVVGKSVGVFVTTFLVTRLPGVQLPRGIAWIDLFAVALLAGIGFTVSLLIGELSFGLGAGLGDQAKVGILIGSVLAALLALVLLVGRNRRYEELHRAEIEDLDGDGIPDIYQKGPETKA